MLDHINPQRHPSPPQKHFPTILCLNTSAPKRLYPSKNQSMMREALLKAPKSNYNIQRSIDVKDDSRSTCTGTIDLKINLPLKENHIVSSKKFLPKLYTEEMFKKHSNKIKELKEKYISVNSAYSSVKDHNEMAKSSLRELALQAEEQLQNTYTIKYLNAKEDGISVFSRRVQLNHLNLKQSRSQSTGRVQGLSKYEKEDHEDFMKGLDLDQSTMSSCPKSTKNDPKVVLKKKSQESSEIDEDEIRRDFNHIQSLQKMKGWYANMKVSNGMIATEPDFLRDDSSETSENILDNLDQKELYTSYVVNKIAVRPCGFNSRSRRLENFRKFDSNNSGVGSEKNIERYQSLERIGTKLDKSKLIRNRQNPSRNVVTESNETDEGRDLTIMPNYTSLQRSFVEQTVKRSGETSNKAKEDNRLQKKSVISRNKLIIDRSRSSEVNCIWNNAVRIQGSLLFDNKQMKPKECLLRWREQQIRFLKEKEMFTKAKLN